jgi:hypothetical protein
MSDLQHHKVDFNVQFHILKVVEDALVETKEEGNMACGMPM